MIIQAPHSNGRVVAVRKNHVLGGNEVGLADWGALWLAALLGVYIRLGTSPGVTLIVC